jgi:DNA-binding beta-propeller fold protein YncE
VDLSVGGTYPVETAPVRVAFDGTCIWVANRDSKSVTKLRTDGTQVGLGSYATGLQPYGLAFDGANIWVANFGSDSLSKR